MTNLGNNIYNTECETSVGFTVLKRLPVVRETQVRSLGWEDPLEKEMANHSSTLAWKIPRAEELGRLQSIGSQSRTHMRDFTGPLFWTREWTLFISQEAQEGPACRGFAFQLLEGQSHPPDRRRARAFPVSLPWKLWSPLHCSAPGFLAQVPSQLRGSAASSTPHGSAFSCTLSKCAPFRFLLPSRPSLETQRCTSVTTAHPTSQFFLRSRPRLDARAEFGRQHSAPQPGAALWRLNRAPSRPSGVGAPRAGCAPSLRLEPALSVASPFGHVPSSLLSADPGDRDSKRPPGRSRAGLHAPGDQQEGSDSGVFRQLPGALLSRRPSELPELAVSGHPGLGSATHGLTALQKPRNQGRLGTPECWESRHPSPLHPCVWLLQPRFD